MNENINKIVVQSALICEDIRFEINGKHILVGVYSSDIGVSQFPTRMSLCSWVQFYSKIAGDVQIGIRVITPKEIDVFNMTGTARFQQEETVATILIPNFDFEIQQEGDFLIQLKENDNEWRNILSLPILKRSSSEIDQSTS